MRNAMASVPAIVRANVDLDKIKHQCKLERDKRDRSIAAFKQNTAKLMIQARAAFNKRGDGFVAFVEEATGESYKTVAVWMKDAGYIPHKEPGAGGNHARNEHDSSSADPESSSEGESLPDDEEDPETAEDLSPEHQRSVFLLRADQALQFAEYFTSYQGPITEDVATWARRVADAWIKLARNMERKL